MAIYQGAGTFVTMNQVVKANIDYPLDSDWFKIQSLGAFKNGILTITVKEGHPGISLKVLTIMNGGRLGETIPISGDNGFGGFGRTNSITKVYDLRGLPIDIDSDLAIEVQGNEIETGSYI